MKEEKHHKEVKKIGALSVLGWIFGILFMLSGLGWMTQHFFTGLLVLASGLIIFPPFNKSLRNKFNFELTIWLRVLLSFILLSLAVYVNSGVSSNNNLENINNQIQQNQQEIATQIEEQPKQETEIKQKVKSASLIIDKVQIQLANLYPTRVTVSNTGELSISPKFDVYVYNGNGDEVCSGSPIIDEFSTISPGGKKTGEFSILGCMFKEDGTYSLKIDLLDENYKKLDTKSKDFEVNYWGQFNLN